MKFPTGAVIGAFLILPVAAGAQTAPATAPGASTQTPTTGAAPTATATPTVGATVYDSSGAVLGTVDQVTPQAVYVNVGGTKVGLPPAAVGSGPQGLRVATTRADILAQAQQAQATQTARLTTGATVRGSGGASVGTIKSVDDQYVTLTTPKGDVKLPANAVAAGPNGATIAMTAAQLDAAITQAGGAAPTQGAGTAEASGSTDGAASADAGGAATATAAGATAAKSTTSSSKRTTTRKTTRSTSK